MTRRNEAYREKRELRMEARRLILDAANTYRIEAWDGTCDRWGMRKIQQAVCVVRRKQLVDPSVLVAAGYRG